MELLENHHKIQKMNIQLTILDILIQTFPYKMFKKPKINCKIIQNNSIKKNKLQTKFFKNSFKKKEKIKFYKQKNK